MSSLETKLGLGEYKMITGLMGFFLAASFAADGAGLGEPRCAEVAAAYAANQFSAACGLAVAATELGRYSSPSLPTQKYETTYFLLNESVPAPVACRRLMIEVRVAVSDSVCGAAEVAARPPCLNAFNNQCN